MRDVRVICRLMDATDSVVRSADMYVDANIVTEVSLKMKIQKITDNAVVPTRGSQYAAGYDLYADLDGVSHVIRPHCTSVIGTGIACEIPEGHFGAVFARSGLATKQGLRPANCVGVIDEDYRGEIKVAIHNDSDEKRIVENHERVAQLVIVPYKTVDFEIVDSLDDTERGAGGFGSTGMN